MENRNERLVDAPYQALPAGRNIPPPPPQQQNLYNNNVYNQAYQPNNVPIVGYNQGFQPNQGNPVYQPPFGQGFIPNSLPSRIPCPYCRRETDTFSRKGPGGVTWIWCLGLFIFTGICCCVPFCVDSCQDSIFVCMTCQQIKARSEANCC